LELSLMESSLAGRRHVVHIGYHRTGTTWLQSVVFPQMRGVELPPEPIWSALANNLGRAEDFLEHTLHAFLEEVGAQGTKPLILSREALSADHNDPWPSGARNAVRLHRELPNARILIVIRRQEDILRSFHWLYVRLGGHRSFRAMLRGDEIEGWRWDHRHLEYDVRVGQYVELFGRENVKVLPAELLSTAPDTYLAEISAFCGGDGYNASTRELVRTRVNASSSTLGVALLRRWNRLFVRSRYNRSPRFGARSTGGRIYALVTRWVDPLARWLPDPNRRARALLAEVVARYPASNTRLQSFCEHSLAELGYVTE
jgi:hypothetical protein